MTPDVSVVVVSFNTRDLLRRCLQTLAREAGGVGCETIVVDNASRDGSADMVAAEFPEALLIRSDVNLGFAAANNRAIAQARGRYVVLVNSDAFVRPGALPRSIRHMDENRRVGVAGGRLIGADGSWRPSARKFPSFVNDFLAVSGLAARYPRSRLFGRVDRTWADPLLPAAVDWVPAAYAVLRRELLDRIGYFDERFFLYYEEVDLCRRVKAAGSEIWYWPDIEVVHLGGESSKTVGIEMSAHGSQLHLWRMRSALLYYRKHHGRLGALAAIGEERLWHTFRAWRSGRFGDPGLRAKAEQSRTIIALLDRAWRETQGGLVSPPRPW